MVYIIMNLKSKIFVAGHKGLVGSAICRKLKALGYKNILTQDRSECDLTNQNQVFEFFKINSPALKSISSGLPSSI